ncbi:MAG: hypothetical protein IKP06_03415 [Elusimicrobiaceae bacterium]|nr:hypothetical protein [Elusimicrobiaceae bacterium]
MIYNKKGAALLQVLLVSAVLAGMATMLLRASLGRTSASRHARRPVIAETLIKRCQGEVTALWAAKTPQAFAYDLNRCIMYCRNSHSADCPTADRESVLTCGPYPFDRDNDTQVDINYTVTATMEDVTVNGEKLCQITYSLDDDLPGVEVVL